jgi:hypothetical protein
MNKFSKEKTRRATGIGTMYSSYWVPYGTFTGTSEWRIYEKKKTAEITDNSPLKNNGIFRTKRYWYLPCAYLFFMNTMNFKANRFVRKYGI